MFVGHYAAAYYLKSKDQTVPLWLMLLCVQFVDLLWAVLIFFGIERAAYDPSQTVFLRAIYEYYPFTHSLLSDVLIASIVGAVVYAVGRRDWAVIAGIAVLSHWFLDVVVHVPDVPIFFNSFKIGIGLWSYPIVTLLLELVLFTIGLRLLLKRPGSTTRWTVIGIYAFLCVFYIGMFFSPAVEPSTTQLGIFGLVLYGGVPLVAYFAERRRATE